MALIALAAAQMLADDVDAWGMPILRALLPIAGLSVIEHQAERARTAGVEHLLVLVDAVPPALTEVCDRIRGRGLPVALVRDGGDVLMASGDADQMLLIADGLIAGDTAWRRVMISDGPAVLVTADTPMTQGLERIDAETRWAGLALLDGGMLHALDRAPPEWDAQLLLLRHAVQQSVKRMPCDAAQFVSGDMALADTPTEAAEVEHRLMASEAADESGMAARWVIGPLLRLVSGPVLRRQNSGAAARMITLLAAIGAVASAMLGHIAIAAGLGLLAAVMLQLAGFIARFRPETSSSSWLGHAGLALQFLALIVAERGSRFGGVDAWLGNGGLSLTSMLLVAWILPKKRAMAPGCLPDLGLAWALVVVSMLLSERSAAFDYAGMLVALLVLVALATGNNPQKSGAV